MSWPTWNQPWGGPQPPNAPTIVPPVTTPVVAAAIPAASVSAGTISINPSQYTPEQWAAMQQQNWQQWMQWQQQYQQWQQQYGEQYQKSLSAISVQSTLPTINAPTTVAPIMPTQSIPTHNQPPLPAIGQPPLPFQTNVAPPPLPPESKPPPPPETSYQPQTNIQLHNFSQPPPSISNQPLQFNNKTLPPFSQPPPPITKVNTNPQHDFCTSKIASSQPPPSLLSLKVNKPNFETSPNSNKRKYSDNSSWGSDEPPHSENRTPEKHSRSGPMPKWTGSNVSSDNVTPAKCVKPNPAEISEAEKKFDEQFKAWEEQFNKWKEQNVNHPDKQQYKEYEAKWEAWRNQLLDRREQMKKKRLGALPSKSTSTPAKVIPPSNTVSEPVHNISSDSSAKPQQYSPPQSKVINSGDNLFQNNTPTNTESKPKSDIYNEAPKEQRQRRNSQRVAEIIPEVQTIQNTAQTNYDFMSKKEANDIPGLDLVEEKPAVIEVPKSSGPDFEAISRGINTILGDEKLMNMISKVSQNKTEPVKDIEHTNNENILNIAANTSSQIIGDGRNNSINQRQDNVGDGLHRNTFSVDENDYPTPPPNQSFKNENDDYNRITYESPQKSHFNPRIGMQGPRFPNNLDTNKPLFSTQVRGAYRPPNRPPPNTNFYRGNNFPRTDSSMGSPFADRRPVPPPNHDMKMDCNIGQNQNFMADRNSFENKSENKPFENSNDQMRNQGGFNMGRRNFNERSEDQSFNRNPPFVHSNQNQNNFPNKPESTYHQSPNFSSETGRGSYEKSDYIGGHQSSFFDRNRSQNVQLQNSPFQSDSHGGGPPNQLNSKQLPSRPETSVQNRPPSLLDLPLMKPPENIQKWNLPKGNDVNEQTGKDSAMLGVGKDPFPKHVAGKLFNESVNKSDIDEKFNKTALDFKSDNYENLNAIGSNNRLSNNTQWEEPILAPATVVDYGHKPVALQDADAAFIEPVQTFDYGHSSSNKAPDSMGVDTHKPWRNNRFSRFDNQLDRFRDNGSFGSPNKYDPSFDGRNRDQSKYDHYDRDVYDRNTYINPRNKNDMFDKRFDSRQPLSLDKREEGESFRNSQNDRFRRFERRNEYSDGNARTHYSPAIPSYHDNKRGNMYSMLSNSEADEHRENIRNADKIIPESFWEDDFGSNVKPVAEKENRSVAPMQNITLIEDLLIMPGRASRPPRIVIILRGPPGSGKTFLAKLLKDKEASQGGSTPRILSLDDYFMVEVEKDSIDLETGRKIKTKEMVYEYEQCMEKAYLSSLVKAFKKTINDGYFSFIIVDCVNNKIKDYEEMWSFAKQNGFQVYVCQMELDVASCTKRNIHGRTEEQVAELIKTWEPTPPHHLALDATSLLQAGCISEVEMDEVSDEDTLQDTIESSQIDDDDQTNEEHGYKSKWETMEHSFDKLARLDGTNKPLRHSTQSMEDYLQLDDDLDQSQLKPGQKKVRWADLVEKCEQEKMRAIGFVVGQTDWNRMMDPSQGSSALTQTKFIESVRKFK